MSSYFEHFLVIKVFFYFTDSFIILLSVILIITLILKIDYIIPSRIQIICEEIIKHWYDLFIDSIRKNDLRLFIPIVSLFFYLLLINFSGFNLFTHPVTTHVNITLGISLSSWLAIMLYGFKIHKSLFISMFMPGGAPLGLSPLLVIIEIISNLSKPVALGMRIAANLTAGHILLSILSDFSIKLLMFSYNMFILFPPLIIIFITILELGVLIIQAYVFCLLLIIYLKDSIILH